MSFIGTNHVTSQVTEMAPALFLLAFFKGAILVQISVVAITPNQPVY